MDSDQTGGFTESSHENEPVVGQFGPASPLTPSDAGSVVSKKVKRSGWRIFWGIVLTMSVLANIGMFFILIFVVVIFAAGQGGGFEEEIVHKGPRSSKIAVINLQGVIDDRQASEVHAQLKRARDDRSVKGMILRINSPGGTVSGSDRIYHEIRDMTDKPVVAFMQGVAASGGYYASVACDKIVAEPTAITGSIGVIAGYLVMEELLEGKLGIKPVVVKSGKRKDWPSSFREPSEEEIEYLEKKLVNPAYERFVKVISQGRGKVLSEDEIKRLADGSIYGAEEAKREKLIDVVGYLDEAVNQAKMLAGIKRAQVIEYRRPFFLADFLGSENSSALKLDKSTLYELGTPKLMYLWLLQ
jgi:protease-4